MIYFLLPTANIHTYKNIGCIFSLEKSVPVISESLSKYLYEIKENITVYNKEWDTHKKYTNPYEYIHTTIPNKKKCVAKHKPLSRSYFKMVEILQSFGLHHNFTDEQNMQNTHINPFTHLQRSIISNTEKCDTYSDIPIDIVQSNHFKTFHLAEGPGGFIEAVAHLRNCECDQYIGMTLIDKTDPKIPNWKKSDKFLYEYQNVFIENGPDKTGDILSIKNFEYCTNKYKSSMDLITADGGFDFSDDFNSQENSIIKLLFAQICFAVCMQKHNGSFVLKIFDCFMAHTIDILYILSSFYKKVYITKPNTSRYANSERYIVCKHFLHKSSDVFYTYIHRAFTGLLYSSSINDIQSNYISRFLCGSIYDDKLSNDDNGYNIPCFFLSKLEEYNSIIGQQQIENIYYTLNLIETKNKISKIENIVKINIQKCINWCIKYNILFNNIDFITENNSNVFLETAKPSSFV
jgi:23S rRNA U2552 (ribose-2'-O)-methylase RlmE/FtsJ